MIEEKMKKMKIPMAVLPDAVLFSITKPLKGIGKIVAGIFGLSDQRLKEAEIPYEAESLGAIAFFQFLIFFLLFGGLTFIVSLRVFNTPNIGLAVLVGGMLGAMISLQLLAWPTILVKKKVRELDRNLVFALRTILVQIRSGVSLFEAMKVVANGGFGGVSKEFKRAVEEIQTGTSEEDALEKIGDLNPSLYFRRMIWQLVNGMKEGSDISLVLAESVDTLAREQVIQLRQYESNLKLLSLVYMMLGVIIPALGITFLIVLSSFPQIKIEESMFWGLLVMVVVSQFMYLGIVKSKRPQLLGDE